MSLQWQFLFDWDGDGSFAYDETEHVGPPFSIERGRDNEFAEMMAGKCTFVLENESRRFDPWNAAGPLYGHILPGVGVRVLLTYGGITYPLFTGQLEDCRDTGELGARVAMITAYDGWRYLRDNECAIALQEDRRTDELIGLVLDAIGWPADMRSLQVGNDVWPYFYTPKRSAAAIINDLVASEYGLFYFDRMGRATFYNRATMVTAATAGSLSGGYKADIQTNQPWEAVYSAVQITCHPTVLADEGTIWQLTGTMLLEPGQTVELWADFADSNMLPCAAKDVQAPAADTDFTANTVADGSGADMTASMSVSMSAFSTSAKLRISNTHPTQAFYITMLKVRGRALTSYDLAIVEDDQTAPRKRVLSLDMPYQQSPLIVRDLACFLLAFYRTPRPQVRWPLDMHLPDLVAYELGDRLTVTEASRDINTAMRLGRIRIEASRNMQALRGELTLEACDAQTYWLRGIPGNSERGITTRYGY